MFKDITCPFTSLFSAPSIITVILDAFVAIRYPVLTSIGPSNGVTCMSVVLVELLYIPCNPGYVALTSKRPICPGVYVTVILSDVTVFV